MRASLLVDPKGALWFCYTGRNGVGKVTSIWNEPPSLIPGHKAYHLEISELLTSVTSKRGSGYLSYLSLRASTAETSSCMFLRSSDQNNEAIVGVMEIFLLTASLLYKLAL